MEAHGGEKCDVHCGVHKEAYGLVENNVEHKVKARLPHGCAQLGAQGEAYDGDNV